MEMTTDLRLHAAVLDWAHPPKSRDEPLFAAPGTDGIRAEKRLTPHFRAFRGTFDNILILAEFPPLTAMTRIC